MSYKSTIRKHRLRSEILCRENGCCFWCDDPISIEQMTCDHIIPKSKGGQFSFQNLVASCFHCNHLRGDLPAEEFALMMFG